MNRHARYHERYHYKKLFLLHFLTMFIILGHYFTAGLHSASGYQTSRRKSTRAGAHVQGLG